MSPSILKTMAGEESTPIQEFYKDATVFITGGTGFMGHILVEKLLRSCPKVKRIILLVRPKKGQKAQHRLSTMFEDVVFSRIDKKSRQKVYVVDGDCAKQGLGLSAVDRQYLVQNVNIVFHAAATVRFNEEISLAVAINIVGTKGMIELAKEMKQLKAFIHVSTAYSNCHLTEIKEKFYPPHISSCDILNIVKALDKPSLEHLTPFLLRNVPNSYVYTKSVAEDYVRTNCKGLPLAVFRPSIIISTKNEPIPGWVDNVYGPTGVVVAGAAGILRSMYCKPNAVADLVPMDLAVNALITSAYKIQTGSDCLCVTDEWQSKNNLSEDPTIYNFVSSVDSPIDWNTFFRLYKKHLKPSINAAWYPKVSLHTTAIAHKVDRIWKHILPALMIDLFSRLAFRKSSMVNMCWKIENFIEQISFFSMKQWKFHNDNTVALWDSLDERDKELFPFSFKNHNWDDYFSSYMAGVREFLMKEDPKSENEAVAWHKKLYWMNAVLEGTIKMAISGAIFKYVLMPVLLIGFRNFFELFTSYFYLEES